MEKVRARLQQSNQKKPDLLQEEAQPIYCKTSITGLLYMLESSDDAMGSVNSSKDSTEQIAEKRSRYPTGLKGGAVIVSYQT